MKELTLKDTVRLHRELWTWLAENVMPNKSMWPRWDEIKDEYGEIVCDCFACAYVGIDCTGTDCTKCPFIWPKPHDEDMICGGGNEKGLYTDWVFADFEERKVLARQIADLPLKPEYQKMLEEEENV